MNKHLNDGQLRAALDGELDSDGLTHLETCLQCQTRRKAVQFQVEQISGKLDFLSSATKSPDIPTAAAWHRFNQQKLTQKETSMFRKLFSTPLVRYGIPALLVLALVFAFPATRALAGELLNLFRVQRVTVVPVDFTGMEQLDGAVGNNISQLISD